MLHTIRRRIADERGFTLIELLVVILIIGILAAIAIPSFLSQKDKAGDASAKSYARNMQTAQETYFTDNGTYGALADLQRIEESLNEVPNPDRQPTAVGTRTTFTVTATSAKEVVYTVARAVDGRITRTCAPISTGGCNALGRW
ncbi:MAG TPA: prepilin-type N-terminal cleavage/methylation domain-containing protein [Conexibacter sp.]|nr:prepilin-type N-terminal cleavage/methylation domain-containing protein [Conexibacter sp.]